MNDVFDRRALIVIVFASVLSEYSFLVMSFIVGVMVDIYNLNESLVGQIVSIQLGGMALGAIGVSGLINRINRRRCILITAILIVGANAVCAMGETLLVLMPARLITGISEGVMMGVAGAIAAGAPRPEKTFSIIGLAVAVAAAFALFCTPYIVGAYGRPGTFIFLAIFAACILPMIHWVPKIPVTSTIKFGEVALKPMPLLALFSFAIFWAGCAGLWVYAERIGLYQGYSLPEIGFYLAIGQIVGVAGPMFVPFLTKHMQMAHIFVIAIIINIFAVLMFVYAPAGWAYSAGAAVLSFWAMMLTPCFRILMALIDRTGIVVAASVAFFTLGYGFAPLLISWFLGEQPGYDVVAIVCIAFFVLSIVTIVPPARKYRLKAQSSESA